VVGEIATETIRTIIACADPDLVLSTTEVATIFTNGGLGTEEGAVYRPPEVMVPQVVDTQPIPLTLQVTP
jgi:hypothetical protein